MRAGDGTHLILGYRQPYQVTDLGPEIHLLPREARGLGHGRDLDVYSRVRAPPFRQRAGAAQPLNVAAQRGEVPGEGALGGQFRGRARDRRPVVADVSQFVQGQQPEGALEMRRVRLCGRAHEGSPAAPAPGLHQTHRPERRQGVAQRNRRDAKLAREMALRRQALTIEEQPQPYRLGEPPDHGIRATARIKGGEQRARADGRHGGGCHGCSLPGSGPWLRSLAPVLGSGPWLRPGPRGGLRRGQRAGHGSEPVVCRILDSLNI